MFAITEGTRKVYGKEITTYTREIYSANVLEVEAGTNGYGFYRYSHQPAGT